MDECFSPEPRYISKGHGSAACRSGAGRKPDTEFRKAGDSWRLRLQHLRDRPNRYRPERFCVEISIVLQLVFRVVWGNVWHCLGQS